MDRMNKRKNSIKKELDGIIGEIRKVQERKEQSKKESKEKSEFHNRIQLEQRGY